MLVNVILVVGAACMAGAVVLTIDGLRCLAAGRGGEARVKTK
ncbi:MAG TPA: hypothetical protein PKZ97_06655 [Azospirillaceae bacterium]|nr:hypothetical protein [Azospirillaceae bacterium]